MHVYIHACTCEHVHTLRCKRARYAQIEVLQSAKEQMKRDKRLTEQMEKCVRAFSRVITSTSLPHMHVHVYIHVMQQLQYA